MSSLFKLSIQGIRSFDSERSETIQFGFPLTLICGQNGCGKTTIIECLKYATTGDLPPNSKGGAFVIDTEIVGRNNVTAQVKLAFKDVMGRSMITTRSMQLTKKKSNGKASSNTFKTLEGQLAIIEKGNKQTLSTKNAELDARIPIHLGASRAVLDYVIFCHQDDNLWPLSEASVLKKRFDEIFEASKFTKVLDNLKTIKKDMTIDIKLIEQSVNHLKIDKERAKKIQGRLNEIVNLLEILNNDVADVKLKIEEKDKEAEVLFQTHQEYQQTLAQFDQLNHSRKLICQQIERLETTIDILDDSYENLVSKKINFENTIKDMEHSIEELKRTKFKHENNCNSLIQEFNELNRLDGSLKSKEKDFQQDLINLESTIVENNGLFKFDQKINRDQDINEKLTLYKNFMDHSTSYVQRLRKESTDMIKKNRQSEKLLQNKLQITLDSFARENQRKAYYEESISKSLSKISNFEKRLESLKSHEDELDSKQLELESNTQKYTETKELNELSKINEKINKDKERLGVLENDMEILNKKINLSNKQSDTRARLSFLKDSLKAKRSFLEKLIASIQKDFEKFTGQKFAVESGKSIIDNNLEKTHDQVKDVKSESEMIRKQSSALKTTIELDELNLRKTEEHLGLSEIEIVKMISINEIPSFEQILLEAEDDYNTTYENLNTAEVSRQFKIKAIEVSEREKHCQLCQRPFDEPGLKAFINLLKNSLEDEVTKKFESDFENAKKDLESLRLISNDVLSFRSASKDKKELIKSMEENKNKFESVTKKLDEIEGTFEDLELKNQVLASLKGKVEEIRRYYNEVNQIGEQINIFNNELETYGASSHSISDLQEEQQKKNIEIKTLRHLIADNTEAKYEVQRDLSRLENKIKDSKLAISHLEKSLSERKSVIENILETNESLIAVKLEKSNVEDTLANLKEQKMKEESELETLLNLNNKKEGETADKLKVIESLLSNYTSVFNRIMQFINRDKPNIIQNDERIEKIKIEIEESKLQVSSIENDMKKLENDVAQSSKLEHNIIANIDYEDLKLEKNKIEQQISNLQIDDATSKREEYHTLSSSIREELIQLNSEYSSKSGEIKQLKDQTESIRKELESEYKDVDKFYHEEWIKLQANLLISNDIQTYSKALDNAIMKYHSSKMENINKTLNELWSQTYKGTDIDTIAIKSDVNIQAKGNRSYNYRVVMYKSNAELDMRGRCSAGQKVLSSILIRLALAECFGINCGMIALDEPTTNLDDDNAESLAQALNQIVSFRKIQRNFQLIVITHDEKFLSHINGDQFAEHFYRVQRDENQRSTIYRLPISKIREG
ncbi:uncharacterized protein PRCAT00002328001 [Priceomyces carsonii]|uniref:uncharacterized protein n=1 Tax=Priceomyces carsonii TaxID=28549 RepID=UPI002ED8ADC2|nr:unnamed protein product [Priceomyces carsonii]